MKEDGKEGKYGATSIRRRAGGREVMTEEGKEGDKVKECRETTGPLFLLKELPHHSALMLGGGGLLYFSIRRGLTRLGLPIVTKLGSLDPSRLLLVCATRTWKPCQ